MSPLIEEYNGSSDEKFESYFQFKDVGSNDPTGSDDFSSVNDPGELVKLPEDLENQMKELNDKVEEELEKEGEEGETGTAGMASSQLEEMSQDVNGKVRDYVDR